MESPDGKEIVPLEQNDYPPRKKVGETLLEHFITDGLRKTVGGR